MLSKKACKKAIIEGMRHKPRVHIGRAGINAGVIRLLDHAFRWVCTQPYPSRVIRVRVHPGCPMTMDDLITVIAAVTASEYAGMRDNDLFFVKN